MRYVIATDGSEASLKAARFLVKHLCPCAEDEIFVVYVFPVAADLEPYSEVLSLPSCSDDPRVTAIAEPILDTTLHVLEKLESQIESVVLLGNPAKEIVEFATYLKADLVLAGTRGRSSTTEPYLGSISSALVHRLPGSLLIAR